MAKIRIFKPAKTAMQSGLAKTRGWCVEFLPRGRIRREPVMGWTGSNDPTREMRLFFESSEKAVAWAHAQGHEFVLEKPQTRVIRPKSYADNFSTARPKPWTH